MKNDIQGSEPVDDELLDVVDGFDQVIGMIHRRDSEQLLQDNSGFIRASELFIINDEGKLWIPIRTAGKTIAPNGYDYSAAGHVESGEDYLETVIRETYEEINLKITPEQIEFVAKLKSPSVKYIRSVYLLHSNQTPVFNPADFTSAEWLTPAELLANIDSGHPAKDSLRNTVVILQAYLAGV